MADSTITKQALASSLKNLMRELPFEKISVCQICEGCGMNRKSFYYHFSDKYDLVNWIFNTEFLEAVKGDIDLNNYDDRWRLVEDSCYFFYENRDFYRLALQIKGQNSFPDHFRKFVQPVVRNRLALIIEGKDPDAFFLDFFTDAVGDAVIHWIGTKDCIPPDQFVGKIKFLEKCIAMSFLQDTANNGVCSPENPETVHLK